MTRNRASGVFVSSLLLKCSLLISTVQGCFGVLQQPHQLRYVNAIHVDRNILSHGRKLQPRNSSVGFVCPLTPGSLSFYQNTRDDTRKSFPQSFREIDSNSGRQFSLLRYRPVVSRGGSFTSASASPLSASSGCIATKGLICSTVKSHTDHLLKLCRDHILPIRSRIIGKQCVIPESLFSKFMEQVVSGKVSSAEISDKAVTFWHDRSKQSFMQPRAEQPSPLQCNRSLFSPAVTSAVVSLLTKYNVPFKFVESKSTIL
eukprot:GHVQ01023447.1.p1 GENE.GHVQ01023447.1~~GHVQ01023447.1.p1  ORF type:complete len:259 (+),score=7.38 GHVQ01023447.1:138-914(+)